MSTLMLAMAAQNALAKRQKYVIVLYLTSHAQVGSSSIPIRQFVREKYVFKARILEPCSVSKWYDKGECSAICGGGYQKRVRDILVQAQEGGIPCPEDLVIPIHCNLDICENGTGK